MATSYATENLICGQIQTDQVYLKADTYYRGMPLKYTSASDYYEYSATGSELAAIYLGNPQAPSRVLSAAGYDSVIIGGEVMEGGIVTDANAAFTVTEDIRAICAQAGIYIKRK